MSNLNYPNEKLTTAISSMATGTGGLAERVKCAFDSFHTLKDDDFADYPDLQEKFRNLMDCLTRYPDETGHEGHVPKTLRLSKEDELIDIATRIDELAAEVRWIHTNST